MVRNLIRNQAPGNRLRVRIPCPPLEFSANSHTKPLLECPFAWSAWVVCVAVAVEWSKRTQGATPAFIELLLGTDFANSNSSTRPQYSRPLDR
jgi:hypothetical protein